MKGDMYSCSCHNSSKELSIGSIYKGIDYKKIVKRGIILKMLMNMRCAVAAR